MRTYSPAAGEGEATLIPLRTWEASVAVERTSRGICQGYVWSKVGPGTTLEEHISGWGCWFPFCENEAWSWWEKGTGGHWNQAVLQPMGWACSPKGGDLSPLAVPMTLLVLGNGSQEDFLCHLAGDGGEAASSPDPPSWRCLPPAIRNLP